MTTLDEQMEAIERLRAGLIFHMLPWYAHGKTVEDSDHCEMAELHVSEGSASYLVACANAAPDLCAEVRRLREENGRLAFDRIGRLAYRDLIKSAVDAKRCDPETLPGGWTQYNAGLLAAIEDMEKIIDHD